MTTLWNFNNPAPFDIGLNSHTITLIAAIIRADIAVLGSTRFANIPIKTKY